MYKKGKNLKFAEDWEDLQGKICLHQQFQKNVMGQSKEIKQNLTGLKNFK